MLTQTDEKSVEKAQCQLGLFEFFTASIGCWGEKRDLKYK